MPYRFLFLLLAGAAVAAECDAAALGNPIEAGEEAAASAAAMPPTPLDSWQAAYNAGDWDAMRGFARSAFTPEALAAAGGPDALVDAWVLDRRRYGTVRYVLSEPAAGSEIHWFRTEPTEAWLGLRIWRDETDAARLTNIGVRRGSSPQAAPEIADIGPLDAHIARYLEALAARDMYSGAALVARGEEVLHAGGYGSAREGGPPNTPDTRFNIASVGKMFTAVAILQLIECGSLSLDDTLFRHVPEYPADVAERVTVRDLLLHTSGIELDEIPEFNRRMLEVRSVADILQAQLDHIGDIDVAPAPRPFDYTNEGINLLGVIVERVSGVDYCAYLRDEVFAPAEMADTSCDAGAGPVATGYMYVDGQPDAPRVPNDAHLPPRAYPAGAHYSTVRDLFRFHRALIGGRLLGPESVEAAMSVQIVEAELPGLTYAYGYGFEVQQRGGVTMVGHSGGMEGVSARYEYFPALDILVVALSNYDTSAVIFASHMREMLGAEAMRRAARSAP